MATTNWNTPGTSGNWDVTTNWDNGVPNDPTAVANIGGISAYSVTINNGETFTVATVNLTDTLATLDENGGLVVETAANVGGTLNLAGKLDLSAGATADVSGTMVLDNGADVVGGTLSGAGTIETAAGGSSTLDGTVASGVTIAKGTTFTIVDNSRVDLGGPANLSSNVINHGEIALGAITNDATLSVDETVMLKGGGTLLMGDPTGNGTNEILGNGALTNVDNTIAGAGMIYNAALNITNDVGGTIDADSAKYVLTVKDGTINNAGLVEATGTPGLVLQYVTLANTGGTGVLQATDGAVVVLNDSTVQGGTLSTVGSGVIQAKSGTTDALDLTTGGVTVSSGSALHVADGTLQLLGLTGAHTGVLTNAGTMTLDAQSSGSQLTVENNVQVTGGGTIELSDAGNGDNQIYSQTGGSTLENVNNTIQGAGTIYNSSGLTLVNDVGGTIDANSAKFGLTIASVTFTNAGVVEATAAGGLTLQTVVDDTGGGRLEASGAGNVVKLDGATVKGGTLTTIGGAEIDTVATTKDTLDASAATNGTVTISSGTKIGVTDNSTLYLQGIAGASQSGTVSNAGTIAVEGGSDATNLAVTNNVTLTGSGTIALSDSPQSGIFATASGSILDNVGNTIQGAGTIYNTDGLVIKNEVGGTIDANFSDTPLAVQANFNNLGTLEATNGGTLALSGMDTLTGTIAGTTGSTVSLSGTTSFGNPTLGGGVTLDVAAALGSAPGGVTFGSGSTATLELDAAVLGANGGSFSNPIGAFSAGETIDLRALAFTAPSTPSYDSSSGTLTVTENGISDKLNLSMPNATAFTTMSDGHGGTDVVAAVCYVSGTRIRTLRGEIAVEDLVVGDRAVTASGAHRPIGWLGRRTIDCTAQARPSESWPVRIRAGAFGANLPERTLYLSPGHPVLVGADEDKNGGALVPIMCLINGTTIARAACDSVTYWHVELDAHDILLAEGQPAESYIDLGSRPWFAGGEGALFDPDLALPGQPGRCRPVAIDGALVEGERQRLDMVFTASLCAQAAWPAIDAAAVA